MDEDGSAHGSFSSHQTLVGASALALVVGMTSAACRVAAFECSNDIECRDGEQSGICEIDGYCSFAHDDCASGRAYGRRAPPDLAGSCVAPDASIATASSDDGGDEAPVLDESSDDATDDGAHRLDDSSGATTTGASTSGDLDDGDESTTASESGPCSSCLVDADCSEGACEGGACRVRTTIAIDWVYDCTDGNFEPLVVLPAGVYQATALPSAGSKWNDDSAVGGLTWAWWIECEEVSFADMRSPVGEWYATADAAFAAVVATTTMIDHPGGALSCGVGDNICSDNRGGVAFELVTACD